MERLIRYPVRDLKGLMTVYPEDIVPPNYCVICENIKFYPFGIWTKRGGFTQKENSIDDKIVGAKQIHNYIDYYKAKWLIAVEEDNISPPPDKVFNVYKLETGGAWTGIGGVPKNVARPYVSIESFADKVILFFGDTVRTWQWDDASLTDPTGATGWLSDVNGGFYASPHFNRLWVVGAGSATWKHNEIAYSELNKLSFDTGTGDTGVITVSSRQSEITHQLISHRGDLFVISWDEPSKVYIYEGRAPSQMQLARVIDVPPLNNQVGGRSVVSIGNLLFFLTRRGLYNFEATQKYGNFIINSLSEDIINLFDGASFITWLVYYALNDALLFLKDSEIFYFSLPTSSWSKWTVNLTPTVLETGYIRDSGSFYFSGDRDKHPFLFAYEPTQPTGYTSYMLLADDASSYVDYYGGTSYSYTFKVKTPKLGKQLLGDRISTDLHFHRIVIYYQAGGSGTLTLKYQTSQSNLITTSISYNSGDGRLEVPIRLTGEWVQFTFEQSDNHSFAIKGYDIYFEPIGFKHIPVRSL